ncbi:MAG: hypothetical protein M0Z94_15110 [Dehalococcoidales bacterium]|nr:hypothetical protein [Dehalococcoidales bacterium]
MPTVASSMDPRFRGDDTGRRGTRVPQILETSRRYKLAEIGEVFRKEAEALDDQSSLKTIIIP